MVSSSFVAKLITYYNLKLSRIFLCPALLNLKTFHWNLWQWKVLSTNIECWKILQSIQWNFYTSNQFSTTSILIQKTCFWFTDSFQEFEVGMSLRLGVWRQYFFFQCYYIWGPNQWQNVSQVKIRVYFLWLCLYKSAFPGENQSICNDVIIQLFKQFFVSLNFGFLWH